MTEREDQFSGVARLLGELDALRGDEGLFYGNLLSRDYSLWIWEPQAGRLFFNRYYLESLGYAHDAFPSSIATWFDLLHPEDAKVVPEAQERYIRSPELGDVFENCFRLRTSSGDYMWVLGRGFIVARDAAGQGERIIGVHLNLEMLRRMHRDASIRDARMRFALEAARDGIWDWDGETGEVYYSPRYLEMLGYTPETFPPRLESWTSRVHEADREHTVGMQLRILENPAYGDAFECTYRFLAADGSWRWILGRGKVIRRNAAGRAMRTVGLHTDITELKRTQDRLAFLVNHDTLTGLYSRYSFEQTFQSLTESDEPVSLIYADVDGLKLVNDNLGHNEGDALLTSAAQLLCESVRADDISARVGGDEFAVLLRRCPETKVRKVVERLENAMKLFNETTQGVPVLMSTGFVSTESGVPLRQLMTRAEGAMRAAKERDGRRNRHAVRLWLERNGRMVRLDDDRL